MQNRVMIGNFAVGTVDGTREELIELKDLLDEVVDRCYNGERKDLLIDLAQLLENSSCKDEVVICREVISEIEVWARKKLKAIENAFTIMSTLDFLETGPGPDAWALISQGPSPIGVREEDAV